MGWVRRFHPMSVQNVQLYDLEDDVWLSAATRAFNVKQAVLSVNVATYAAWWHMATKHRPDLLASMRGVLASDLPVVLCASGCGRKARSQRRPGPRPLCINCYMRERNGGTVGLEGDRPVARGKNCSLDGCEDQQYAKELCNLHWQRLRSWGNTGGPDRLRRNWWLAGFTAEEMRACKEFVYGKRDDRPPTDEGIRLRIDYEAIIKNDPCVYCGGPGGEVEHVVPSSRGGSAEWDNLASACRSCNASKHASSLLVYLLVKNGR